MAWRRCNYKIHLFFAAANIQPVRKCLRQSRSARRARKDISNLDIDRTSFLNLTELHDLRGHLQQSDECKIRIKLSKKTNRIQCPIVEQLLERLFCCPLVFALYGWATPGIFSVRNRTQLAVNTEHEPIFSRVHVPFLICNLPQHFTATNRPGQIPHICICSEYLLGRMNVVFIIIDYRTPPNHHLFINCSIAFLLAFIFIPQWPFGGLSHIIFYLKSDEWLVTAQSYINCCLRRQPVTDPLTD